MAVEVCDKSSDKCFRYFEEIFETFKPIVKLTSFLDNANFLLNDYHIQNPYINTIIENDRGDQIQFDGLNCGYGGEGPNCTAKVLEKIGIDKETAERWMYLPGLSISFPDAFKYVSEDSVRAHVLFVQNRGLKDLDKFELNCYSRANVVTRKIYSINPQLYNFPGFLNLLNVMQPTEMEYNIGPNSQMSNSLKISDVFSKNIYSYKGNYGDVLRKTNSVNLIIYGEKFDIICFISEDEIASTVNCIYSYLMYEPLFKEKFLGEYVQMPLPIIEKQTRLMKLKCLFHNRFNDYHATVSISGKRRS